MLLHIIVALAANCFDPLAIVIGTWDPEAKQLIVQAAQAVRSGATIDELVTLGSPAMMSAILARTPTMCAAEVDAGCAEPHRAPRSILAVPACREGAAHGGMLLYFAEPHPFTERELALAGLLGDGIAVALDHAQRTKVAEEAALMSERNRIARDLHDSVTQALFTISMIAETMPHVWRTHPEAALQSIERLQPLAQSALAEMRALLLELRTEAGADRNLGDLLRQLADRTLALYDLPVTMTAVGDCRLPKHVQSALYRIAQEALHNTSKHARASRAVIHLHCQADGGVTLRISDDGRGMDPNDLQADQLGMRIMRERAAEIGATFRVDSKPGAGTTITTVWRA